MSETIIIINNKKWNTVLFLEQMMFMENLEAFNYFLFCIFQGTCNSKHVG